MADENYSLQHEIILYATPDGNVCIEVVFADETFWLSQKKMAELFRVESHIITYHLKEIYKSGELKDLATTRKIRVVQPEGGRGVARGILLYNLDTIIAVGYRVNSHQATQFRIWATQVLREYLVKGFVLDDERLKQGKRHSITLALITARSRNPLESGKSFVERQTTAPAVTAMCLPRSARSRDLLYRQHLAVLSASLQTDLGVRLYPPQNLFRGFGRARR